MESRFKLLPQREQARIVQELGGWERIKEEYESEKRFHRALNEWSVGRQRSTVAPDVTRHTRRHTSYEWFESLPRLEGIFRRLGNSGPSGIIRFLPGHNRALPG